MRYWWVNHKQTARHELAENYLWSPRREANGARSQFYENMRLAEPGDVVFSFSNGIIGHIGVVQDFAVPANKPDSFGNVGEYWDREGWLLSMVWQALPTPLRPKDHIGSLAPLLPHKYSPIHPVSGNGNQKAYLAEVGKSAFDYLMATTNINTLPPLNYSSSGDLPLTHIDDKLESTINDDLSLDSTTKEQLILARKGQGLFRSRVFEFEKSCKLTNVLNPRLLVASHIKPWRLCRSVDERLDGANGLLLTPHVDRLFDRGLISFGDDGQVIVSSRLDQRDLRALGLDNVCAKGCTQFHPKQTPYLEFHRTHVLLP